MASGRKPQQDAGEVQGRDRVAFLGVQLRGQPGIGRQDIAAARRRWARPTRPPIPPRREDTSRSWRLLGFPFALRHVLVDARGTLLPELAGLDQLAAVFLQRGRRIEHVLAADDEDFSQAVHGRIGLGVDGFVGEVGRLLQAEDGLSQFRDFARFGRVAAFCGRRGSLSG